ncbi:hypothetical protein MKK75_25415 [Methylobacterium sp. J-030]|uniref:hypothetical protein n=1 Tax=Methylobacterium sp. J-030 TaxID=2836627 RepID=UPI001FBB6B3F|nr:hypothetical protein [Methylobacterium sp. J-030]MCJ2072098.1 hypothetical protein [Methylobacterium sp. J-030]
MTRHLDRNPLRRRQFLAAMTNHAVLAGSVLAGVALWAGVYLALLPRGGPGSPEIYSVSATPDAPPADYDAPAPAPRRWADLPRETAQYPAVAPDASAASVPPDAEAAQDDLPPRRRRPYPVRPAALPDVPLARHLVRQRARLPAHVAVRRRFRRVKDPIQFSLATRSSS